MTIGELLQKAAIKRGDKVAMMAEPRSKTQLVDGKSPPPVPHDECEQLVRGGRNTMLTDDARQGKNGRGKTCSRTRSAWPRP